MSEAPLLPLSNEDASQDDGSQPRTALSYSGNSMNSSQHGISTLNLLLKRAQFITIKTKILALILVGTIIGSLVPKNDNLPTPCVRYLSSIIGYTYFLCWSISFYPQLILNYTRKSTTGLSTDFCILNLVGFGCYTVYTTSFFFSDTIRKEYGERNNDGDNSVESNDVAFALHAFVLSSIQMFQIAHYDTSFSWQKLSVWTRYFLVSTLMVCFGYGALILVNIHLQVIDFIYLLSSIKLAITITKYIPQVLMNYKRKSTIGWNVWTVLLDFAGGMLSLSQLMMDAYDMNDSSAITGNWVKFGLSFVSIFFDIIFIVQHYILYRLSAEDVIE